MKEYGIGTILLRLRKEQGLTQRELANVLHISDRTVSKWECAKGTPDISLLQELSTYPILYAA